MPTPYENFSNNLGLQAKNNVTQIYTPITNYIYLYHTNTLIWLPNWPDNLTDNSQAQFSPNTPLGRSAPIFSYQSSGPRSISFQFELHRELLDQVNGQVVGQSADTVDDLTKKIQAAVLPVYASSSKMIDPPLVACKVGNEVYIKGVINGSVSVAYSGPILYNDKHALCNLSFTITEVDPYDAYTVEQIGSFRQSDELSLNTSLSSNVYTTNPNSKGRVGRDFGVILYKGR